MRSVIERYINDRGSLVRSYPVEISPARQARFKQFYSDWLALIAKMNFDAMSLDGKVDYVLFKYHLDHELQQLEIQNKSLEEIAVLVPFANTISNLAEARRRMEKIEPQKIAAQLNDLNKQVEATRRSLADLMRNDQTRIKKTVANRAMSTVTGLRNTLRNWYGYYNAYDPLFTCRVEEPYRSIDQSFSRYAPY